MIQCVNLALKYHKCMATGTQRHQGGARDLARRAVRAQVGHAAFDLFQSRGYDGVTVEEICTVAGISRSTFFRHFTSKDDALLSEVADSGDVLRDALVRRPDDEPIWTALRRALDALIDQYVAEPESAFRLAQLVTSTPALAGKHHEKNARWQALLRPEVARRLGTGEGNASDPRPSAIIAAALGCVDASIGAWLAVDGTEPLGEILDSAMGSFGRAPATQS